MFLAKYNGNRQRDFSRTQHGHIFQFNLYVSFIYLKTFTVFSFVLSLFLHSASSASSSSPAATLYFHRLVFVCLFGAFIRIGNVWLIHLYDALDCMTLFIIYIHQYKCMWTCWYCCCFLAWKWICHRSFVGNKWTAACLAVEMVMV